MNGRPFQIRHLRFQIRDCRFVIAFSSSFRVHCSSFLFVFALVALASVARAQEGPPRESGTFREPELVELVRLDRKLRLDIRYATANNFVGRPVYTQARAFLQRPAAEALSRARRSLRRKGYGLLVFDAYRPWRVTRLFWDLTPADKKQFVADPSKGSRHNRGCAVDLTLYDLRTGREVPMPSSYDDFTERAHVNYPGGTPPERAARAVLRAAMAAEGFQVYEPEWWHFDYKDWREYPILNLSFEEIDAARRKPKARRRGRASALMLRARLSSSVAPLHTK